MLEIKELLLFSAVIYFHMFIPASIIDLRCLMKSNRTILFWLNNNMWYIVQSGDAKTFSKRRYAVRHLNFFLFCNTIQGRTISLKKRTKYVAFVMVSVSVCQAGCPGLNPALSICFGKVEFYQHVNDLSPQILMTVSPKAVHVLLCLRDNACKRSLAICWKSRASFHAGVSATFHPLNNHRQVIYVIHIYKQPEQYF